MQYSASVHFGSGSYSSEVVNVFFMRSALNRYHNQRWSRGHKAREAKAKDSPLEDRPSRSQGQECSRPRTQAQVFSNKNSLSKKFQAISKKRLQKFFGRTPKKGVQIFFGRSTKFLQFKKFCCLWADDRAIFENLRLRGQGQGLRNVSSRTPAHLMIIPSVEMRQENLSIDRVTNISGNFVEMAGDSRLCSDFVQLW